MRIRTIRWNLAGLCAVSALLSTSAHAVWTFNIGTPGQTLSAAQTTNIAATTPFDAVLGTDPSVTLSGFSAANTNNVVTGSWTASNLVSWTTSGVGMHSGVDAAGSPNHAIDNFGATEAVLMSFSSSVVLSSIGLGWTSDGTCSGTGGTNLAVNGATNQCPTNTSLNTNRAVDLSVFRWVGTGTPPSLAGSNAALHAGWQLVGNYGDMVVDKIADPNYNKINTGTVGGTGTAGAGGLGSSWWLISAYNSGFAQSAGAENRGSLNNGSDYFKLFAVAGTACVKGQDCGSRVPEPASLALVSVALLGVAGLRRRQARVASKASTAT